MLVLDLPQLYTHPPASVLLESLANLTLKPATWSVGVKTEDAGPDDAVLIADHGIPNYLTSIVISRLQWIEEDLHEAIWEAASTRLCERAGRAGERHFLPSMPNMIHFFPEKTSTMTARGFSLSANDAKQDSATARLPQIYPFVWLLLARLC